jgi:type II secretory pathway component PulK
MAAGKLLTAFSKKLSKELQDEFSNVIDEIERETYWETRQDLLNLLEQKISEGKVVETVQYLLTKDKPGV